MKNYRFLGPGDIVRVVDRYEREALDLTEDDTGLIIHRDMIDTSMPRYAVIFPERSVKIAGDYVEFVRTARSGDVIKADDYGVLHFVDQTRPESLIHSITPLERCIDT